MRFLRTASTARLLAVLASVIIVAGGGAAIAVAATTSHPTPAPSSLAGAIHTAATGPKVDGISANISFTNNLIDSTDFTGQSTDPLLQGASGRIWVSDDGQLRLELQSSNGDAQVVVDHRSFWISDPTQHTVYEGTLPAPRGDQGSAGSAPGSAGGSPGVPSVAQIQSELTRLMGSVDLSGAQPTDVAGQSAYRVTVSPKTSGGLVGDAQLAFDAANGTPLDLAVYARGDTTPVIELKATSISYGAVSSSVFDISPPAGSTVVQLGGSSPGSGSTSSSGSSPGSGTDSGTPASGPGEHMAVHGLAAVSAKVPFTVQAPATLAGMARHRVTLIGHDSVLVTYGTGLGGLAVIESPADSGSSGSSGSSSTPSAGGLSLPTPTVNGQTAMELPTPLGTVIHVTQNHVAETVIGSVSSAVALQAARGL